MAQNEKDTTPMMELNTRRGDVEGGGDAEAPSLPPGRPSISVRAYQKIQERRVGLVGIASVFMIGIVILIVAEASYQATVEDAPPITIFGVASLKGPPSVGATSATHYLAAEAGMAAMRAGGNAADAAATMQFVLNVVQPFSTGIGGGFFALLYNASTGKVETLDAREEAPSAFHPEIFCKNPECQLGPCNCTQGYLSFDDAAESSIAMGIPGTLMGVDKMIKNHGRLTLKDALQPAIKIAREGWEYYSLFDTVLKGSVLLSNGGSEYLPWMQEAAKLLLNADRTAPRYKVGERMTNHDLAGTLELLAEKGVKEFYEGTLAREMIAAMGKAVGRTGRWLKWTLDDLKNYRAVYRRPINTTYRGYQVMGMGAPSSGGIAVGEMLNLLEGFDLPGMRFMGLDHLATKLQAENLAFADRNKYVADTDFVDMPVSWSNDKDCARYTLEGRQSECPDTCRVTARGCEAKGLLSKSYARERRAQHMTRPFTPTPLPAGEFDSTFTMVPPMDDHGTTHLVATDKWGNVVSMTTTIEQNFGSLMVVPGRGYFINNELTDFNFAPTSGGMPVANAPSGRREQRRTALGEDRDTLGGKRPRSSMAPTIVLRPDGKPLMAVGSPGGSYIIGAVMSVILGVLDFGLPVKEAIDAPRVWGRNQAKMQLEVKANCNCDNPPFEDPALRGGLEAFGFQLNGASPDTRPFVQAVQFTPEGGLVAAADDLRAGKAGAYAE